MADNNKKICKNLQDFKLGFRFYEKVIEARNLQYNNYNTWVHYYAIFTGALFVGYYTILSNHNDYRLISLLIALIGLVTSICWHLTVKGHYHWMLSYIKVLHNYEKELAFLLKKAGLKDWRAYAIFIEPQKDKSHENLSSQKMTSRFTFLISFAWYVLSVRELQKAIRDMFDCMPCYDCICSLVISVVIMTVVYAICKHCMINPSHIAIGDNMTDKLYTGWKERRWAYL